MDDRNVNKDGDQPDKNENQPMPADPVAEAACSRNPDYQFKLIYSLTDPRNSQNKKQKKPREPAIRILKRPSHLARGQVIGVEQVPLREFEERNRKYEEARHRIFGAARNPADDVDDANRPRVNLERFDEEVRRYLGNQ